MHKKQFMFFVGSQSWGHSFFVQSDGKLCSFGCNGYRQCVIDKAKVNLNRSQKFYHNPRGSNVLIEARKLFVGNFFGDFYQYKHERISEICLPSQVQVSDFQNFKIVDVATGYYHTVMAMEVEKGNVRVFSFGQNQVFQTGRKEEGHYDKVKLKNYKNFEIKSLRGKCVRKVCCGESHSLFVSLNNDIFGCGKNGEGQLGCGHFKNTYKIVKMKVEKGVKILDVSAGTYFSVVLTNRSQNNVLIAGFTFSGYLHKENRKSIPQYLNLKEKIVKLSAGSQHVVFLGESNAVYGYGTNCDGQLSIKNTEDVFVPTEIKNLRKYNNVIDVKCGRNHTVILLKSGSVIGFGHNDDGQLGCYKRGENPIILPLDKKVVEVYASGYQTYLIDESGQVYSAGYNAEGQLGLGHTITSVKGFTPILGLNNIKRMEYNLVDSFVIENMLKVKKYFDISISLL